jgi:hypothetical protein
MLSDFWVDGTTVALHPDQTTNPVTEEGIMRADGQTIRGNAMEAGMVTQEAAHPDWTAMKRWTKATFTKERVAEAAMFVATVAFAGTIVFCLHKGLEHYVILGL